MKDIIMNLDLKKHPYLFAFLIWLYLFFAFGYFETDNVVTISYIVPIIIAGIIVYLYSVKKEKIRKIPKKNRKAPLYALGAVIFSLAMIYTFAHVPPDDFLTSKNSFVPLLFLLAGLIAYCIFLSVKKKWSVRRILFSIFILSCILHLFYILTAKFFVAQWDMGSLSSGGHGHLGYIEYLYKNFLPAQFDPREKWQYYHPPLHHFTAAMVLKLQSLFGGQIRTTIYNVQFITMLYAMISSVCVYEICRELKLRNLSLILAFSIVALSPAFVYVGGYVNNDMMATMFTLLCISYTIKWYNSQRMGTILKIALFFGLGMLTKMSVALIAFPIAVVFLFALFKKLKEKDMKGFKGLFGQMCAFLGVAAPLSLYWSLRNLLRFGIPIGYVPESTLEEQFIPEPLYKRVFDFFSLGQYSNPFFNYRNEQGFNEYNPIIALIKTSATDQAAAKDNIGFPLGLAIFWLTVIIASAAFIMMIYVLIKKNTLPLVLKLFFSVMYVVYIYSYISFCIQYTYTCTEQIRYAMPLIVEGALFIGLGVKSLKEKNKAGGKVVILLVSLVTLAFCLSSVCSLMKMGAEFTIQWMIG